MPSPPALPASQTSLPLRVAAGLPLAANPLLTGERIKTVDVEEISVPTVHVRSNRQHRRELRDLRRKQKAAEAIAGLDHERELYGFTKGQFSLLDLMTAVLAVTGPAHVALSTWTAARHEIQALDRLVKEGRLLSMRWLIDFSFSRRDPEAAHQIRQTFGLEAVRVAQNHSKFALFEAPGWEVVLRTSMNLNMNPRFEDFSLAHDPELAAFLRQILTDIWNRQTRSLAHATSREQRQHFASL